MDKIPLTGRRIHLKLQQVLRKHAQLFIKHRRKFAVTGLIALRKERKK